MLASLMKSTTDVSSNPVPVNVIFAGAAIPCRFGVIPVAKNAAVSAVSV